MSRRVVPYALAAAVLLGGGGCYQDDPLAGLDGGPITKVLLTDAPFPFDTVESVNIHIVSIAASPSDSTDPSGWVTIAEPRRRINLLSLQQGTTTLLGAGTLPADQYRSVRVTIDAALSDIRFVDGAAAVVNWGGSGQISIYAFVEAAVAVSDSGAEIVIDFDVGRSFRYDWAGDGVFDFIPWIRAVNKAATGSIAGTVTGNSAPIANAGVVAYGASQGIYQIRSTGFTDATGHYRLAYLLPGTYIVQVDAPRSGGWTMELDSNVVVTQGVETDLSIGLIPFLGAVSIVGPASMNLNQTAQLEAVVVNAQNQRVVDPVVAWENLDPAFVSLVATSDDTASVTSVGVGVARVIATSGGLADTTTISVYDSTQAVARRPPAARRAP